MGLSHNIIKGLNVARAIGVVSRQSATGTKCIFNTSINRSPKEVLLPEKAAETKCVVNGKTCHLARITKLGLPFAYNQVSRGGVVSSLL